MAIKIFAGAVFAFEQDGGGFAGGHAADEVEGFAHEGGLGDDLALLGGGFFGYVFNGGDYALEGAVIAVHLRRAHDHEAFHAVIGMEADGGVGRGGRLVQADKDAAAGFAYAAAEDVLAVAADHVFGGHTEEFFSGVIDSGYGEIRRIEDQRIR